VPHERMGSDDVSQAFLLGLLGVEHDTNSTTENNLVRGLVSRAGLKFYVAREQPKQASRACRYGSHSPQTCMSNIL